MNTPSPCAQLPCEPATEKDTVALTQQVLHALSPNLGAYTLDSTQYGAAIGLKARDQAWVRVLPVPSLERLSLPLAQGWQTSAQGGEFTVGWPFTPQALRQPLLEQYLLWWSEAQGCALLVPAQAWWQAGWDLWLALTQVSLTRDQLFRPQLQWQAAAPRPARWHVHAWLPSHLWLRALQKQFALDDVLLMSLREDVSAPSALFKAYSTAQFLPTKTLPALKALSTTLLHASEDSQAANRARECSQLTPLGAALAAQCASVGPADWLPAHQVAVSAIEWQAESDLLQSPMHGPWPTALKKVHLRTGPADNFGSWPTWDELEPALASASTPGFAPVLKSYFEKAHY